MHGSPDIHELHFTWGDLTPFDHRLRLLFIESVADYGGGSERVSHDLAIQLSRAGHQVFYAVPREGTALSSLRLAGVNCIVADIGPVPFSRPILFLKRWCIAAQLVLETRADHLFTSVSYLAPLLGSLQVVLGRRAAMHLGLAPDSVTAPMRWAMRLGVFGIAPSTWARDVWRAHGWPASRLAFVPNGVDLERFCLREDRVSLRHGLGWADQEIIITCVGRLTPEKGLLTLFRAFAKVAARFPYLRLALFGHASTDMIDQIRKLAAAAELPAHAWHWHGATAQPECVLAAGDMAIVPSEAPETFGLSVVEAMACGSPVIVSDVTCFPQLVGEENRALVFPAGDFDALAARLATLAAESPAVRRRLGARLRERVAEEFPLKKTVTGYLEILLKRSPPNSPCSP